MQVPASYKKDGNDECVGDSLCDDVVVVDGNSDVAAAVAGDDDVGVDCCGECTRYGICFTDCVTKTFNLTRIDLSGVMGDCQFIRQSSIEEVGNDGKKFLLYWLVVSNVYMFCGKHNRCELPCCVVNYICSLHPNPVGIPYSN